MRQRELWASLLDDNVVMTLPITPYRSFHRSNIVNSSRVVRGVDGVMADAASLSLLAECIGQTSAKWKSAIKRYFNALIRGQCRRVKRTFDPYNIMLMLTLYCLGTRPAR